MKIYEGNILTCDAQNHVYKYLVEDGGRIAYVGDELPAKYVSGMVSQGPTPRRLTDLIGSLCDLTSGSGDKGTPFVYIQGYFDNYTTE